VEDESGAGQGRYHTATPEMPITPKPVPPYAWLYCIYTFSLSLSLYSSVTSIKAQDRETYVSRRTPEETGVRSEKIRFALP
jgi:hypothetical protein